MEQKLKILVGNFLKGDLNLRRLELWFGIIESLDTMNLLFIGSLNLLFSCMGCICQGGGRLGGGANLSKI